MCRHKNAYEKSKKSFAAKIFFCKKENVQTITICLGVWQNSFAITIVYLNHEKPWGFPCKTAVSPAVTKMKISMSYFYSTEPYMHLLIFCMSEMYF